MGKSHIFIISQDKRFVNRDKRGEKTRIRNRSILGVIQGNSRQRIPALP